MLFSALLLLPSLALATPSDGAVAVCKYLNKQFPKYTAFDPLSIYGLKSIGNALVYNQINQEYWNRVNTGYRPTCAFFPSNANQVSAAVQQLNKYSDVPFALKSGGHQFNPGFSATKGGVVISFNQNLANTIRSPDGNSFVVGPGSRWGDVYKVTGETQQIVVGGRLSNIGVAGLTLGGGLSYYSSQYGLACDGVINYEVVTANGTIVNANAQSNPDLYWALKGGGNRFGIVTAFTLKAHSEGDNGQIWGGTRFYDAKDRDAIFKAQTNFIRNYSNHPKAAIILTFNFVGPLIAAPVIFFFYDGATPPPGIFDEFDAIKPLNSGTKTKRYTDMVAEAGGAAIRGFSTATRVNTFPNYKSEDMVKLLERHYQVFGDRTRNDTSAGIDIQVLTFTPQPLSVQIAKASQAQGPNTLDLRPEYGDRVWVENDLIWINPICDNNCPGYLKDTADMVKDYQNANFAGQPPTNYKSGDVNFISNNPLFMNDAADYQDVYASYGATNLQRLRQIKKAYDPEGFFDRQGGWPL